MWEFSYDTQVINTVRIDVYDWDRGAANTCWPTLVAHRRAAVPFFCFEMSWPIMAVLACHNKEVDHEVVADHGHGLQRDAVTLT